MPTLRKNYILEVTIDQFLNACSDAELIELEKRLPDYTRDIKRETEREPLILKP